MPAASPAAPAEPNALRYTRWAVFTFVVIGVLGVAAMAFYASFEAISKLVEVRNILSHDRRWIGPLLIDTFTGLGTGLLLGMSLSTAYRGTWYRAWVLCFAYLLIGLGSGVSAAANVAHVHSDDLLDKVLAGSPTVALLLSIEVLVIIGRMAFAPHLPGAVARRQQAARSAPAHREGLRVWATRKLDGLRDLRTEAPTGPALTAGPSHAEITRGPRPAARPEGAEGTRPGREAPQRRQVADAWHTLYRNGVIDEGTPVMEAARRIAGEVGSSPRTVEGHLRKARDAGMLAPSSRRLRALEAPGGAESTAGS